MKVYGRSRSTVQSILNLGTRLRTEFSFLLRPFYHRGKRAGAHEKEGWAGPRTGLNALREKKVLLCLPLSVSSL